MNSQTRWKPDQNADSHQLGVRAQAAPVISFNAVTKSYGSVKALRGVTFDVHAGEVVALLGQNGAGKSTLIKVLAGVTSADGGDIAVDGLPCAFTSTAASRAAGVAVVYQELSLVPSMTIGDNLLLAREPSVFGFVKRGEVMKRVQRFLDDHGFPLRASDKVESLPFAYRQLAEIAKSLIGDVRVLVLDEPTSALSADEEEILFKAISEITKRGVGVIYVTHRLNEVFRLSNKIVVLRDGASVGTFETSGVDMSKLVSEIVGAETKGQSGRVERSELRSLCDGSPILDLKSVCSSRLRDASLSVRRGEILGLAGMVGSGRTEVLETIAGFHRINSGSIKIEGSPVKIRDAADGINRGIGLVPEDRHVEGLILDHTIEQNIVMPMLRRFGRYGFFRKSAATEFARAAMARLSVKAQSHKTVVGSLSGGNQQKVVFGRWTTPQPKILLLDEPTVGVDVGAREQIYQVIRSMADNGSAVVVVSSDFAELLLICDRISIVTDGCPAEPLAVSGIKDESHLHYLVQESLK